MPQDIWDKRYPKDICELWEKYQNQIKLTCFFKNIIRALQDLFGFEENIITKKNWLALSKKIISSYGRKDWYYHVPSKKAGFEISFLDIGKSSDLNSYWNICRNANMIQNVDPLLLNNLFLEYPKAKFILFHFSFPFINKALTLTKMFPNVFLDFCWMSVLSKRITVKAINEYLDLVPYNKLMWGGDSFRVEEAYGVACNAREIISLVLSQKVERGEINIKEASKIAQAIFHDNAK